METPGRSSSVPAIKRRHVEILSPDKDQILANMIVDFQTSDFPPYLKLILDALVDTREQLKSVKELCDKINEENVALRSENLKLRQLLQSQDSHVNPHVSSSPAQSSQTPPVVSPPSYNQEQDLERARSIVLSGVPESSSMSAIERASNDLKFVHSVLDHLNVECLPCAVYRMGKPDVKHSRLIKVVLPSSRFQQVAVKRAPRLRTFPRKGIYLRPSLTKEERERQREERLAKMSSKVVNNAPTSSNSVPPPNPIPPRSSQNFVIPPCHSQGNL